MNLELPAYQARKIEQVVHQPRLQLDVALDDVGRACQSRLVENRQAAQQADSGLNCPQRIAQFAGEHREEVILGIVGGLQFGHEAIALQRGELALGDVAHRKR